MFSQVYVIKKAANLGVIRPEVWLEARRIVLTEVRLPVMSRFASIFTHVLTFCNRLSQEPETYVL